MMVVRVEKVGTIVFDVFGTVVDWRSSVIFEVQKVADSQGISIDVTAFVDEWKSCYREGMDRVNRGAVPWTNVDVIYRRKLDELLPAYSLGELSEAQKDHLNRAWTRLTPWPDSVEGLQRLKKKFVISTLSNGNFAWLVDMAKHTDLPWDCVLTAENARRYKPDAAVYRMAIELFGGDPSRVMLAAAHNYDLAHARSHGMATAFIPRPREYGPDQQTDLSPAEDWDVVAADMIALADTLGA